MNEFSIELEKGESGWHWYVVDLDYLRVASGTTPDYDEACRMAKIAWEQHSEGET